MGHLGRPVVLPQGVPSLHSLACHAERRSESLASWALRGRGDLRFLGERPEQNGALTGVADGLSVRFPFLWCWYV